MGISDFMGIFRTAYLKLREQLSASFHGQSFKEVILSFFQKIKDDLLTLKHKMQNLHKTNYDLGMLHYNTGSLADAIFRFKLLKKFYKDSGEVDYYIGRCYIERNQPEKAKPYIEDYLKSPDERFREEAKYCYDLAHRRLKNIKQIPPSIVERTFDILAPKYNQIFLTKPNPPQDEVYKAISAYMNEIGSPYGNRVLDLGCGTGYIVSMLRRNKIAGSAHGIDNSSQMISICQNLKVDNIPCYDSLVKEDLNTYFTKNTDSLFDVIIASKVLSYFNDPLKLFTACKNILKPKGAIALSFKVSNDEEQMQFDAFFEEFQFNEKYIAGQAAASGLLIKTSTDVRFPDGDQGIIMLLIKE